MFCVNIAKCQTNFPTEFAQVLGSEGDWYGGIMKNKFCRFLKFMVFAERLIVSVFHHFRSSAFPGPERFNRFVNIQKPNALEIIIFVW